MPQPAIKERVPVVTTANKITLFRILLVPVFIGCGVYYGQSVADGVAAVHKLPFFISPTA